MATFNVTDNGNVIHITENSGGECASRGYNVGGDMTIGDKVNVREPFQTTEALESTQNTDEPREVNTIKNDKPAEVQEVLENLLFECKLVTVPHDKVALNLFDESCGQKDKTKNKEFLLHLDAEVHNVSDIRLQLLELVVVVDR